MKTRNTSQDAIPLAAESRREIGSDSSTTPNRTRSGTCPVRLAAIGNAEVVRTTWMDFLRDLRVHLENAAHCVDVQGNLEEAANRLSVLFAVLMTMGCKDHCCLEGNLNKVRIVRCLNALRQAAWAFQEAYDPTEPNYHPSERQSLIIKVLRAVPAAEEFQKIVDALAVPFCACPSCARAYSRGPVTSECLYCRSILEMGERSIIHSRGRLPV